VISWNGVATYGALAAGAPLGVQLAGTFGFVAIGAAGALLMVAGLLMGWRRPAAKVEPGERLPMRHVFGRVLPYGTGLALGAVGFGALATFVTLYYAAMGWSGAAATLSVFGACFVGVRLVFGGSISRFGGYRVALVSFVVECAGLVVLAAAGSAGVAMVGGALTGVGFSLIFPALGVEAVQRVTLSNRGSALGAYSVFTDLALGVAGPLGGWLVSGGRYGPLFVVASGFTAVAIGLTAWLYLRYGRATY
jgi:predicted MFS family arabinose efflux permease